MGEELQTDCRSTNSAFQMFLKHSPDALEHLFDRSQKYQKKEKTNLLCRLQAHTLPDATPPIGKIYHFTKIAVTFEPVMRF